MPYLRPASPVLGGRMVVLGAAPRRAQEPSAARSAGPRRGRRGRRRCSGAAAATQVLRGGLAEYVLADLVVCAEDLVQKHRSSSPPTASSLSRTDSRPGTRVRTEGFDVIESRHTSITSVPACHCLVRPRNLEVLVGLIARGCSTATRVAVQPAFGPDKSRSSQGCGPPDRRNSSRPGIAPRKVVLRRVALQEPRLRGLPRSSSQSPRTDSHRMLPRLSIAGVSSSHTVCSVPTGFYCRLWFDA